MKSFIGNIMYLPQLAWLVYKNLNKQRNFLRKTIKPEIDAIRKTMDDSLNESDFRKITKYYGLAVPAILGEGFCLLRGTQLTNRERTALTYYGAISGMFDDFFDEKPTDSNQIKNLINQPFNATAQNSHQALFLIFYKKALEYTIGIQFIKKLFNKVFDAQFLSLKQKESNVDKNTIEKATFFKGGISLVFYRYVFDDVPTKEEEEMIYKLGALMQIENDIFDVYKDNQENISTLATIATNIHNLREHYVAMTNEVFDLVRKTQFNPKNKRWFIRYIGLVLFRGNVCLDCIERNEKSTNNLFIVDQYKRKKLVCDMENLGNMLRMVKYYLRLKV